MDVLRQLVTAKEFTSRFKNNKIKARRQRYSSGPIMNRADMSDPNIYPISVRKMVRQKKSGNNDSRPFKLI